MAKLLTSVSYLVLLSQAPYTLASNLDDTKRFLSNDDTTTGDGDKNAGETFSKATGKKPVEQSGVKLEAKVAGNGETVSEATDKNPVKTSSKVVVVETVSEATDNIPVKIPDVVVDPKTAGFFDNFGKHLAGKNMVMTAAAATAIVGSGVVGIFSHKKNQKHQRLRRQQALAKLAEWESSFK